MDLEVMRMELRKGWKGFTVFILVVVLIAGGMAQLYPVVSETFEEGVGELEGEEHVRLEIREDSLYLEWEEIDPEDFGLEGMEVEEYIVLEDTGSHMATSRPIGRTRATNITITDVIISPEQERYYGVVAVVGEFRFPVGITSTVERKTPLEEMMETPYFQMFTAGREDLRMDEIEGFMAVELYSWWILLVGVYLSYLSVKSVTGDFEERRMDILFSTPLSRKEYLIQKFMALGLFSLLLVVLAGAVLVLSVYSLGEGLMLSFFVSVVASWPMLLVIIAVSMFFAVVFKSSRGAIGASFGIILVQYALFMAGHMLEELKFVLPFTISNYWDYNAVLLDGVFKTGHFLGLFLLGLLVFTAAILIFEREDIPV